MALKSHFKFSNSQRNGIFLLVVIIVILQCIYAFVELPEKKIEVDKDALTNFRLQIDSLKAVKAENSQPKLYPFNPNYITDFKGYTLGMSPSEIDRLLEFRKKGQWVNSASQFQEVTQISDSLLASMAPLFSFPDWITNPKTSNSNNSYPAGSFKNKPKSYSQKIDLNLATAEQLKRVNGIGEKLSDNILKYRSKFKGGFISEVQLQDVYGLSPEVIERITNDFAVKTPRPIEKIDLNTATIEQLVTVQYIDYEIAHHIIEQRTLREGFKSIDELLKVKKFPAQKFEIIKLYLVLK